MSPEEPSSPSPPQASPPGVPVQARWKRPFWLGLGLFFVALGALGVVTPVLPTTPFLLLASFFFLRSSPPLHAWLRRSPLFGPLLSDWERQRGVRRGTKIVAVSLTVSAAGISLLLTDLTPALLLLVLALVACGVVVILRLPTIDERPPPGSGR